MPRQQEDLDSNSSIVSKEIDCVNVPYKQIIPNSTVCHISCTRSVIMFTNESPLPLIKSVRLVDKHSEQ